MTGEPTPVTGWARKVIHGMPARLPERKKTAVQFEGLTYACYLETHAGSNSLLVYLRAVTGPSGERPVLGTANLAPRCRTNLLVISDPGLLLDPGLRTGIFLGMHDNDPLVGVAGIAEAVAASLGLGTDAITFWGHSGGGFAALMAAVRTGSAAIVLNPQTDLPTMRFVADVPLLLNRFRPGLTPDDIGERYAERVNVVAALRAAQAAGRRPRLSIFQNVRDTHHHRRHFLPLCEAVAAEDLCRGGWFRTFLLDYPEKHRATDAVVDRMIAEFEQYARRSAPAALPGPDDGVALELGDTRTA